jgi:BirA family biotin operon repressor/biotin-[acetyl-CoA-carboxylase] ligase
VAAAPTVKPRTSVRRSRDTVSDRRRLLAILADGRFHSGEDIATALGVSRSAVWKHLNWLRAQRIELEAVRKRGYRLAHPVDLLDAVKILEILPPHARGRLMHLDTLLEVDSTNRYLGALPAPEPGVARACVAEIQSAGRGRRGRVWLAPFGSSLCVSIAWTFAEVPASFPALGLAIGVGITRALAEVGASGLELKWPNDIVWHDHKLGGILIEVRGFARGGTHVVVGIGLNVRLPPQARLELAEHHGVHAADLNDVMHREIPQRNHVAAAVLEAVPDVLVEFEARGFAPFIAEWETRDAVRGRRVRLVAGDIDVHGVASGVGADGALLLDTGDRLERFVAGDLSLRLDR